MCVAVAGKVISIEGDRGKIDFNGNIIPVKMALVEAKEGDYVLVHAGYAMEIIEKRRAEEMADLFRELEEVFKT